MIDTPSTTSAVATQMLLAYDKMPDPVLANITQLGGYLVFVVDFLAALHVVYVGASLAVMHFSDHRLPVPTGQRFMKIMAGIWICAAAGSIAAVVIGI